MSYSADTFVADEQPTTAKWNKLWSNDASFNDGTGIADDAILSRHINDGQVLPNHIKASASSNNTHVWDTWTPTLGGTGSVGNGTLTARYIRIGNTIHFFLKWVWGSTSTIGSSTTFTVPVAAHAGYEFTAGTPYIGGARIDGSNNVALWCRLESANTIRPVWMSSSTAEAGVTTTSPGTWTTGDTLSMNGIYECVA